MPHNDALQRTRRERRGYNSHLRCAGSLSLGALDLRRYVAES